MYKAILFMKHKHPNDITCIKIVNIWLLKMYESIKTSGEIFFSLFWFLRFSHVDSMLILETFDKGLKCATSYSFVT